MITGKNGTYIPNEKEWGPGVNKPAEPQAEPDMRSLASEAYNAGYEAGYRFGLIKSVNAILSLQDSKK